MFDPVPVCPKFNSTSVNLDENHIECLNHFISRVQAYAGLYEVNYQNRFSAILTICTRIKALLKEKKNIVWPAGEKEPITEFQDLFQLLIYALGDDGLLYDDYGKWTGIRQVDDADIGEEWASSEVSYKQLAFAMRSRHASYLSLKKLRTSLEFHTKQHSKYDDSVKGEVANPCFTQKLLMNPLKSIFPDLDTKSIDEIVKNLYADNLLMRYAPLYLFSIAVQPNKRDYSTNAFLSFLNCPNKDLTHRTKMVRLEKTHKYSLLYHKIEKVFYCNTSNKASFEFDPFRIIAQLKQKTELHINAEQHAQIANKSMLFYTREVVEDDLSVKINGTPIMDIMKAFFTVWKTEKTNFTERGVILPRNAKGSLRLLYNLGVSSAIPSISTGEARYTNTQYNEIKAHIFEDYFNAPGSSSQEIFWLLSGYVPPRDFPFPKWYAFFTTSDLPSDLYTLCDYFFWRFWHRFKPYQNLQSPSFRYSKGLYLDTLRARSAFAEWWNKDEEMESTFIDVISDPGYKPRAELLAMVREWYDNRKTKQTSFKNLKYDGDEIYKAILKDCFSLTGLHIYEEVFTLLASLNESIWPI